MPTALRAEKVPALMSNTGSVRVQNCGAGPADTTQQHSTLLEAD